MRVISILLCLMLSFGSACASMAVRMEDTAALLRRDGYEIVPPGVYEDIVHLGGNMFAAGSESGYGLMNDQGVLLTKTVYTDLTSAGEMTIACRGKMYGLLNAEGQEVSEFIYTDIIYNGADAFWALKGDLTDGESDEIFILNKTDGESASGLFVRAVGEPSEGLLPVLLPGTNLWGYCDSSGNMAIDAQFSYAASFIRGLAAVEQNGKCGAIDTCGNVTVPFEYDFLQVSAGGFVLAAQNLQGVFVLDSDGGQIAFHDGEETFAALVGDGYMLVQGERLRIFDSAGNLLESAVWDASVSEGLNGQAIIAEGAWGEECVRLTGADGSWQNLYPLGMAGETGIYAFMQVRTARYMNDLLDEIQYAADMESARYGVINGSGEVLIPCEYKSIEYLENDRLLLRSEAGWQVMDAGGKVYWKRDVTPGEGPNF